MAAKAEAGIMELAGGDDGTASIAIAEQSGEQPPLETAADFADGLFVQGLVAGPPDVLLGGCAPAAFAGPPALVV